MTAITQNYEKFKALEQELGTTESLVRQTKDEILVSMASACSDTNSSLLPPKATLAQCQSVVAKLHRAADKVRSEFVSVSGTLEEAFKTESHVYHNLNECLVRISESLAKIKTIDNSNRQELRALPYYDQDASVAQLKASQVKLVKEWQHKRQRMENLYRSFDVREETGLSALEHVAQVLMDQPDEMRQQVLQNTKAHRSLDFARHTRPKMSIEQQLITDKKQPLNRNKDIPLDVASVIFEHCDLESLVQLRQANRYWFSAFHALEAVLQLKVKERNPWMEPRENGTELETWGDCALVFVGRKKSGKWKSVKSIDDISLKNVKKAPTQCVLATETDQELGSDFRSLKTPTVLKLQDGYNIDMQTLRVTKDNGVDYKKQTLVVEPDKIVVVFADPKVPQIKLPPPSFFGLPASVAKSSLSVTVSDQLIVATFSGPEETVYVMPRDFPYFYYGYGFKYTADMGVDVVNYILPSAHALQLSDDDSAKSTFLLSDVSHRRFVSLFEASPQSTPVSVYNGFLYMVVQRGSVRSLVPVMIDLKDSTTDSDGSVTLKNVFWRESRVIGDITGRRHLSGANTRRYVTFLRDFGQADIVDLATGSVVLVDGAGEVFPGFTDGRFEVWQYSEKAFSRYRKFFKRFRRHNPFQLEYDVSQLESQDDVEWGYNREGKWVPLTEEELDNEDQNEEQEEPSPLPVHEEEDYDDEEESEEEELIWTTDRWGKMVQMTQAQIDEIEEMYGEHEYDDEDEGDEW